MLEIPGDYSDVVTQDLGVSFHEVAHVVDFVFEWNRSQVGSTNDSDHLGPLRVGLTLILTRRVGSKRLGAISLTQLGQIDV